MCILIVRMWQINTPRRFLVDKNLLYWDPSLGNVVDTVNQLKVNGVSDWQSQMILMNSRTKAMFDDDAMYPFLTRRHDLYGKAQFY